MDFFQIPDDYVPEKLLTKEEMDQNTNYLLNHPLFLKDIPEDMTSNPHLVALNSLMQEEQPEVKAENFNKQANLRLKQGPNSFYYMSQAYKKYTEAINLKCSNKETNAKLHANRAAINLKFKNYGKVIDDCKKALTFDENYSKAYYRMAKAYIALKKYEQCISILKKANNEELIAVRKQAQALLYKQNEHKDKKKEEVNLFSNKVEEYFKERKWILGKSNRQLPEGVQIQFYENNISIPIIVIYPEFTQFDLIAKTSEKNKIGECIKELFLSPLPWDSKKEYSTNTIELFLEIQEAVLLTIPRQATISELAARAPVKGAIEIHVVAKNAFSEHFKSQYKIY